MNHEHVWIPRSDIGRAWYSCSCGAAGRRDIVTGRIEVKGEPSQSENKHRDRLAASKMGAHRCRRCGCYSFECDCKHAERGGPTHKCRRCGAFEDCPCH